MAKKGGREGGKQGKEGGAKGNMTANTGGYHQGKGSKLRGGTTTTHQELMRKSGT